MTSRPHGIVTFLFTDIVGSTQLWERFPASMPAAFAQHERLLRQACASHAGFVYKMVGDALQVAFASGEDALLAAVAAQRALIEASWGETGPIAVRMALHSGQTEERGDDYVGPLLNRLARMLSAGAGGQILVSQQTADLLAPALPPGIALRDLGEHRLKHLTRPEHIYQVVAPDLPSRFPPLKSLTSRPTNVPCAVNSFIGRSKEINAIIDLLRHQHGRLITITGPGGMGKTRLMLQLAGELHGEFPDGVFWVALDVLNDPELVLPTIARALGVVQTPLQPLLEALKVYLRDRCLLLVLDNFEHLLDAAPLLSTLLQAAPQIKIVATSRTRLNLYGEHQYSLAALSLPPASAGEAADLMDYDAIRLFVARVCDHDPAWAGGAAELAAIHAICIQLDGMPLALELAAAHTQQYALAEIVAQLADRLAFLTNGPRDVHTRQRTLRATLDWSYAGLPQPAQAVFSQLGVFQGGWSLDMLEQICADTSPQVLSAALDTLVAQHLVAVASDPHQRSRYQTLETIRAYSRDLLRQTGQHEAVAARHASAYIELARSLDLTRPSAEIQQILQRLIQEQANFRAAMEWLLDTGRLSDAACLCSLLWRYWDKTSQVADGWGWASQILARIEDVEPEQRAAFLHAAGNLANNQSLYSHASQLWSASLRLREQQGDLLAQAHLQGNLGVVALHQGRYRDAENQYTAALALFRRCEFKLGIGRMLNNLAVVAMVQGDEQQSLRLFQECIDHYDANNYVHEKITGYATLAQLYYYMGRYSEAHSGLMHYLDVVGVEFDFIEVPIFMGYVTLAQNNPAAAASWLLQGLSQALERGEPRCLVLALMGWALFFHERNASAAVAMLGLADRVMPADALRHPVTQRMYDQIKATTMATLGEQGWQQAWIYGASIALDQIEGLIQAQLQQPAPAPS